MADAVLCVVLLFRWKVFSFFYEHVIGGVLEKLFYGNYN